MTLCRSPFTLQELNLSGNEISKRGASVTIENMNNKPNLKKLDLNCKFHMYVFSCVAFVTQKNK